MKLGVLFSGGKDSCLALHKVLQEGHEVKCLLSIVPENEDSFMFHKPSLELLKRQAEEIGIELKTRKSKGVEEKELKDLKKLIEQVKENISGIVVGGIASSYQAKRIKKICEELSLEFIAPLWDYSPGGVWEELLREGFKVIIMKTSCEGLGKDWIGVEINKEKFEELKRLSGKYKFRIDFEGGEAETAVLWMPEFRHEKGIKIKFTVGSEGKYRHFLKIKNVE